VSALSFERVRLGLAVIAGVAVLAWLFLHDGSRSEPPAPGSAAADHVSFADETLALGVLAEHRQGDDHLTGLDETLGSGACALDYDNDGWTDLFVVNGSGDTRYYGRRHWWQSKAGHSLLHNRHGTFEDVSGTALASQSMRGFGCVAADFDNDGYTDVFITGFESSQMLRNLGNGRFMDVTHAAGLAGHGWETAAAAADVDGDGLLDLYVGRLVEYHKEARLYEPGSQYKQDVPGTFNSALYPAQANSLYRNLGGFRFEDVATRAGVANPDGRTLGVLWVDFDDDERPDLLVANAAGTGSTVAFHNDGNWRFTQLGAETRLQSGAGARAPTLADLDNDGVPEILMTATNGAQSALFVRQGALGSSSPEFNDRARRWGFARDDYSGFSPWSAVAADFNNDGWLDVFVGNGLAIPDPDVPRLTTGQPKQLWLNSRRGELLAQAFPAMAPLLEKQSARGVVAADFDNDGDIDLYVTHNNDLGQLLINESGAGPHWASVRLVNTDGNRDAIGARVELVTDSGRQYRWLATSAAFLSGSERRLHFGLGRTASIERVVVTWPDGKESTFRDLPVDRDVTLTRGERKPQVQDQPEPIVAGNYASLAHGREPALRADYIRLLVEARGFDASIEEIRAALHDPDETVRAASVEVLAANQSAASLAALLDAFSDDEPAVVLAAIDGVCRHEEERATRWLLRLFAHPDAAVRAKLADCFAYYFHEEEAVIYRKYLALPYLIEALDDDDEHLQIAAARALGNAERFRGVHPLLRLAERTPTANVRAEAIRAIGLIRDKQATPGLVEILRDRKAQSEPGTLAQLLVALKRLDYPALPTLMQDFGAGRGPFAGLSPMARLDVLQETLKSEDGVVLARQDIAAVARRMCDKAAAASDEAMLLKAIDVLREAASPESIRVLMQLADSGKSAAIKAAALHALVVVDPTRAASYVERGLGSADTEVGVRLLASLRGTRVDLDDRALLSALARPQLAPDVATIVRRVRTQAGAAALFELAARTSTPIAARAAALDALARSPFKFTLPAELYATTKPELAQEMVRYVFSQLPPLHVSRTPPPVVTRLLEQRSDPVRMATIDALAERREFWAKNSILAVLKSSAGVSLRGHVIELIARGELEGSQILELIATDRNDPLRLEALRRLEGRPGSSAEQLLMQVLRDGSEEPHARVVAAHRLVGRLGPEVLALLERST
jgi:HEAT repeat protein